MSIHHVRALATCTATLALAMLTTPAAALTRNLVLQQNGTGACQAALPNFEGVIRKRPLAIQNEGASTSFVTCSPPSLQGLVANDTLGYNIRLVNRGSSLVSVNCTAVIGSDGVTNPLVVYLPKNANIGGNSNAVLTWRTLEGYDTSVPFNVQCELPPGVGISGIQTNQTLDVGN